MSCPDCGIPPAAQAHACPAGGLNSRATVEVSAESLRSAVRGGRIVPWVWDLAGGTLTLLENAQELCGPTGEARTFAVRDALHLVAEQDHKAIQEASLRTRVDGLDFHCQFRTRMAGADGGPRWFASRGTADNDGAARPQRVWGVTWDITQQVACEITLRNQLVHTARLGTLGELAAGLAHELNQPLAALRLFASAARELGNAPELYECLRHIDEQSCRAGEIIRRMRSFAGNGPFRRGSADLNQLVREVLWILDNELRHARVAAEAALAESLPTLCADAIQLQQILVNLIRNAIDAMAQPGRNDRRLVVRTQNLGSKVEFSVTDSGCGLAPAIAARLFEPFQTTKATGLGLGLSICRTLVEGHGGSIRATANPAGGTTFLVTLPVAQDPSAS